MMSEKTTATERKQVLDELCEQSQRIVNGKEVSPRRRAVNPKRENGGIMRR